MSSRASAVPLYLAKPRSTGNHAELMLRVDSNLLAMDANDKYVIDIVSGPDGVAPNKLHNIVKTNTHTREMRNIQFALTKTLLAENAERARIESALRAEIAERARIEAALRAEIAERTRSEAALRAENDRVNTLNGVLMNGFAHQSSELLCTRAELYQTKSENVCLGAAASREIMPAAPPDDRFLAAYNNIMGGDESCATDDVSTPAPEPTLESLLTALAEKRQQEYQQQ